MSSRCLCCLPTGEWVHRSQRDDTVKLRWFDSEYRIESFDLSNEADQQRHDALLGNAPRLGLTAARDLLGSNPDPIKLPVEAQESWREVCQRLKGLPRTLPPIVSQKTPVPVSTALLWAETIPQTPLRQFYDFLRLFSATAVHEAIADYVCNQAACAKTLEALFADSTDQFARYKNETEEFCPPRHWALLPENLSLMARKLVARLDPANWPNGVPVEHGLDFLPVGYEVSFRRTTGNAVYESGKSATNSGLGGIDLLLKSMDTGLPIVAEVKAPGDTNLFFALVQALMHAVELTTDSQFARLCAHEPVFREPSIPTGGKCDVYLIFFKVEATAKSPKLLAQATTIADHLMADPLSAATQKIRRIVFLEADFPSETVAFKPHHVSPRPSA